ncbi:MAG: SH3 domain-containing protein [bacterium]|nr:SH3 domain-containing protein [Lachnospiraceae bacterium]MBQ3974080.1 SH3 domain-containing protein [Lachnospiraceae bacterium]
MKSFKVRLITGLMSAAVAAGSVSLPAMAAVEISEAAAEMSAEAESSGDIAEAGSSLLLSSVGTNAVSNVLGQDVIADTGKTNSVAVASSPETVSVRSEASEDGAVVGRMKANDVATVLEDDGGEWIRIKSGDVVGYVKREELVEGKAAEKLAELTKQTTAKVMTASSALNVRSGPGTDYDIITGLPAGTEIDVSGEEDGWIRVNLPEYGEGYISADYAEVDTGYPTADTAEEIEDMEGDYAANLQNAKIETARAEKILESAQSLTEDSFVDEETALTVICAASDAVVAAEALLEEAQQEYDDNYMSGQAVVDYAMQFLGNPYVYGGTSLTHGCDCSGFTMGVFAHFGISLPHYDASQRSYGTNVGSLSNAQPGDLVCFYGHVGIYIGNNQIVHASTPRSGIKVSDLSYMGTIACIRRLV